MEEKKNDTKFGFALGSAFAFGGIVTIIIDFEHIIMENIIITLLLILGMVGMGTGISNANDEKEKVLMNLYLQFMC